MSIPIIPVPPAMNMPDAFQTTDPDTQEDCVSIMVEDNYSGSGYHCISTADTEREAWEKAREVLTLQLKTVMRELEP